MARLLALACGLPLLSEDSALGGADVDDKAHHDTVPEGHVMTVGDTHALDLTQLTLAESAALLERGEVSPVELLEASLAQIERLNPQLHAFITVAAAEARVAARDCEARIRAGGYRGGIDGIPVALKDNIETAGIRTTSHSRILREHVPSEDATVVARLKAAGATIVGKTATFEFAVGGPSWDLPWPPAVNPWDAAHLPGGSSSGSGAALAARMVAGAIGTDTGGSVRWPAAVCGITGLKPTYGRVSRYGIHPNTFSLDHCGPMARTAEDCALLLQAIAGHDPRDPASFRESVPDYRAALDGSIAGLRIGFVRHWHADHAAPEVIAAVDAAVEHFVALGAVVEEVELPPLQDYVDCKTVISLGELFAIHEQDMKTRPQEFGRSLRQRVLAGSIVRAEDYVQALRWRSELAQRTFAAFTHFDLLVTAGWLTEAEPNDPNGDDFFRNRLLITMPFSLAGNPALSLPCGFSKKGLPLALQIAGRPFDEATVLRAGDAFQRSTDWHRRFPPLHRFEPVAQVAA